MNCKLLITLGIIAVCLYCAVRKSLPKDKVAKSGESTIYGNNYENISAAKHDFFKILTTNILSLLFFSSMPLLNRSDFFGSIVGRAFATAMFFMAYHSIVQPYVSNRLPAW